MASEQTPQDYKINPTQRVDRNISKDTWFRLRQLARTNLRFLCNDVLGFRDVSLNLKPHASMIAALQQFKGGWETGGELTLENLRKGYKPKVDMWDLQHPSPQRRTLILCSRDFLKSTLCTIAHKIQWNINYPNVRILISSGTGKQVNKFMSGILQQYRFNDTFRWLFPEFVPMGKVDRFGSMEGMTCEARTEIHSEMTFTTTSVGSAVAGGHYDVVDHDDVVNEENVHTPDSIQLINDHIRMTGPLLMRKRGMPGWTDFIGTRYDYTDAYGVILDDEKKKQAEGKRVYVVVFEPAWTGPWGVKDKEGKPVAKAVWEDRYPISALEAIENDPLQGPSVLASQYGLIPRPASSGLVEDRKQIVWTPRKVIDEIYAQLRLHVTIDLHGMAMPTAQNKRADRDYTAVTLAGFGRDGHCYVISIYHGRPNPLEVIEYLFFLWHQHPRIVDFKCQTDHMYNTLMPFLQREQTRRQIFLPMLPIPVNSNQSKTQKLMGLIPWFRSGTISFADTISCRFHLEEEILRFPRFHDDILDTIRDQMSNQNPGGIVTDVNVHPKPMPEPKTLLGANPVFLGFGPDGGEIWSGLTDETQPYLKNVDPITGL